jgi:predicted dehydrogenase
MLKNDELDVVTICTPSGAHMEPAVACAEADKHVICEKPLDVTLERVDQMVDAHEKAGTMLCGIFPYRFSDVTVAIKQAADRKRFGTLTFGMAHVPWWRDQSYYTEGGWKGTRKYDGGGALMNQSIHAVDSLIWLMGDVASVSAFTDKLAHPTIEVEDTAAAAVRFKNGALGSIVGTTSIYPGHSRSLEICGDGGTAVCVEDDLAHWNFKEEEPGDDHIRKRFSAAAGDKGGASDPSAISFEGHRRNFAAALESLDKGESAPIDGREARKAIEVILAIYKSSQDRRPVDLPLK